jgi:hypothetical protein
MRSWVTPAALTVIGIATAVALVIPSFADSVFGDAAIHPALFCMVLVIVAVAGLLQARLLLFPRMETAGLGTYATPQQLADALAILAVAFSVAPAIYGIVVAVMTGDRVYVVPFPVIALITLTMLLSYANDRVEQFNRSTSMEATR